MCAAEAEKLITPLAEVEAEPASEILALSDPSGHMLEKPESAAGQQRQRFRGTHLQAAGDYLDARMLNCAGSTPTPAFSMIIKALSTKPKRS